MARTSTSRERILQATEMLLREGGLAAAGIKQVVGVSGAPIGSVYHYFPGGKEQMVIETLQRHGQKARDLLGAAFAGDRPLPEQIRELFSTAAREFDRMGGTKSCAIGNVTLDLGRGEEALRGTCCACFDSWVHALEPLLPWPDERRRRSFAEMLIVALEGAFVLARAQGSGSPFVTAGEWLAGLLGQPSQALPTRRKRSRK